MLVTLATPGNWGKNADNNPAVRTVLTWQRVQLSPKRQRSALKSGPRWDDLTFRGETYYRQSGMDLRVKARVWTFSPQIDEFGGRSPYYFNAGPTCCALWNPALDLCILLCLQQFLSCHTTGARPIYYGKVPLSSHKNARHSLWDKPPCPSCTSMLVLINRPQVPATQILEQASITDELPPVYVFLLNNW